MKIAVKDLEFTPELMALIDEEKDEDKTIRVKEVPVTHDDQAILKTFSPLPHQGR